MASSASAMDPLIQQYYALQRRNVNDTYQIGLAQNNEQKGLTDLSYQQKLSALQDKLGQEQNALPNSFAARGLMNSGIWNWNGAGQLGAKQQFAYDSALSLDNLRGQQNMLDQNFHNRGIQLGTVNSDSLAGINNQQATAQSQQAISDAIAGA